MIEVLLDFLEKALGCLVWVFVFVFVAGWLCWLMVSWAVSDLLF